MLNYGYVFCLLVYFYGSSMAKAVKRLVGFEELSEICDPKDAFLLGGNVT